MPGERLSKIDSAISTSKTRVAEERVVGIVGVSENFWQSDRKPGDYLVFVETEGGAIFGFPPAKFNDLSEELLGKTVKVRYIGEKGQERVAYVGVKMLGRPHADFSPASDEEIKMLERKRSQSR